MSFSQIIVLKLGACVTGIPYHQSPSITDGTQLRAVAHMFREPVLEIRTSGMPCVDPYIRPQASGSHATQADILEPQL
jgi:hypothetical protein